MRVLLITIFTFFCLPVVAEVSGPTYICESYRSDLLKSDDEVTPLDDLANEHPYITYVTFNKDKSWMYYYVSGEPSYLDGHKAIHRVLSSDNLVAYAIYAKFSNKPMAKYYTTYFDLDADTNSKGDLNALEVDLVMGNRIIRTEYRCKFHYYPLR